MNNTPAIPAHLMPGAKLRHYKGGLYTVVGHCLIEATLTPGILYRAQQGDSEVVWMRPMAEFDELVAMADGMVRRFTPV